MPEINSWEILKNTLITLWKMWPIWIVILAIVIIKIFLYLIDKGIKDFKITKKFKKSKEWRSDRKLIQWVRVMNPDEFEKYTAWIFDKLGYKTKVVGRSHDQGIDVIAEKNNIKHYIQCKRYAKNNTVGVHYLRDFYGAIADKLTEGKAYFVTTSKFTLEAEKYVEDKPIELIDSFELIKYIRLAEKESSEKYEINNKICPKCGGTLILRKGKYGKFYGCSNYPECKYTEKL